VTSVGASPDEALRSAPTGLDEALTRARRLVSKQVGIISEVTFVETSPDEPRVYVVQSNPADLSPVVGRAALNSGTATSTDRNRAIMKAVGESVERYCCAFYDEDRLRLSTFDELSGHAVGPENFALFDARQYAEPDFPFAPFTPYTAVRWVQGRSVLHDRTVYVPAGFVYIPYARATMEPVLDDQISTGLACGTTYVSALTKAICEAVERDAYMIVWQNSLRCPHIDLDAVTDPLIRPLVDALQSLAVTPHALLLTLDIPIPVVLIVMTRVDGPPFTIVASGADLSPKRALMLALEEACLAMIGMTRSAAVTPDYRPSDDYDDVTAMEQHGLAHATDPRLRCASAFLSEPTDIVRVDDLPDPSAGRPLDDLDTVLRSVRPFVSDVVAVDVTTCDVDEVGFKVVRAVVPELQRMDINHRYRHLGGRRLYDVPFRLGRVPRPGSPADMNPYPHPFP
jgi:ribosomal protein S12 methylthiotransferase accessory factor